MVQSEKRIANRASTDVGVKGVRFVTNHSHQMGGQAAKAAISIGTMGIAPAIGLVRKGGHVRSKKAFGGNIYNNLPYYRKGGPTGRPAKFSGGKFSNLGCVGPPSSRGADGPSTYASSVAAIHGLRHGGRAARKKKIKGRKH